jgi:hypothetical protein
VLQLLKLLQENGIEPPSGLRDIDVRHINV